MSHLSSGKAYSLQSSLLHARVGYREIKVTKFYFSFFLKPIFYQGHPREQTKFCFTGIMGKDLEQLFSNIFLPQFNQRVEYHSLSDKYLILTHTAAEKCI